MTGFYCLIFPAYAGLNLHTAVSILIFPYIPRIRGVEPTCFCEFNAHIRYSPHTRG